MKQDEKVSAALLVLAQYCGIDSLDSVTSIEADAFAVKVTEIRRNEKGAPLTKGAEYVTHTIERRWR